MLSAPRRIDAQARPQSNRSHRPHFNQRDYPRALAILLLNLTLPRINEHMTSAVIRTIYVEVGAVLPLGAKLLDLCVDLSAVLPHDCLPVSMYRIALRDRVWLRKLGVAPGDDIPIGAVVALFSTEPDESLSADPARAVRVTIAGIVDPSSWWSEGTH
jgi:hypothetical protein